MQGQIWSSTFKPASTCLGVGAKHLVSILPSQPNIVLVKITNSCSRGLHARLKRRGVLMRRAGETRSHGVRLISFSTHSYCVGIAGIQMVVAHVTWVLQLLPAVVAVVAHR